jgi:hypothetical protein
MCKFQDSPFRDWLSARCDVSEKLREIAQTVQQSSSFWDIAKVSEYMYCPLEQHTDRGSGIYASKDFIVVWDGKQTLDVVRFPDSSDMMGDHPPGRVRSADGHFVGAFLDPSILSNFLVHGSFFKHHFLLVFRPSIDAFIFLRLVELHNAVPLSSFVSLASKIDGLRSIMNNYSPEISEHLPKNMLKNGISKGSVPADWVATSDPPSSDSSSAWDDYRKSCTYRCFSAMMCFCSTPILGTACDISPRQKDFRGGLCVRTGCCDSQTIVFDSSVLVPNNKNYEVDLRDNTLHSRCSCPVAACLCLPLLVVFWPTLAACPPLHLGCRTGKVGPIQALTPAPVNSIFGSSKSRFIAAVSAQVLPPPPVPSSLGLKSHQLFNVAPSCCGELEFPADRLSQLFSGLSAAGLKFRADDPKSVEARDRPPIPAVFD